MLELKQYNGTNIREGKVPSTIIVAATAIREKDRRNVEICSALQANLPSLHDTATSVNSNSYIQQTQPYLPLRMVLSDVASRENETCNKKENPQSMEDSLLQPLIKAATNRTLLNSQDDITYSYFTKKNRYLNNRRSSVCQLLKETQKKYSSLYGQPSGEIKNKCDHPSSSMHHSEDMAFTGGCTYTSDALVQNTQYANSPNNAAQLPPVSHELCLKSHGHYNIPMKNSMPISKNVTEPTVRNRFSIPYKKFKTLYEMEDVLDERNKATVVNYEQPLRNDKDGADKHCLSHYQFLSPAIRYTCPQFINEKVAPRTCQRQQEYLCANGAEDMFIYKRNVVNDYNIPCNKNGMHSLQNLKGVRNNVNHYSTENCGTANTMNSNKPVTKQTSTITDFVWKPVSQNGEFLYESVSEPASILRNDFDAMIKGTKYISSAISNHPDLQNSVVNKSRKYTNNFFLRAATGNSYRQFEDGDGHENETGLKEAKIYSSTSGTLSLSDDLDSVDSISEDSFTSLTDEEEDFSDHLRGHFS